MVFVGPQAGLSRFLFYSHPAVSWSLDVRLQTFLVNRRKLLAQCSTFHASLTALKKLHPMPKFDLRKSHVTVTAALQDKTTTIIDNRSNLHYSRI